MRRCHSWVCHCFDNWR